ncbi:MAG: DUF1707 domain-containing protein [Microlunatus sp.]|nr:DUF1707 domain-containing protein [Microlunatus sp.]
MEMSVHGIPPERFQQQLGTGAQRIGEAERSATCDVLSAHFAAGRLTADELEQRLALTLRAATVSELWQLTADLPLPSTVAPRPPAPATRAGGPAWPALSVLAVLALIGSLLVAGGLLIVLGAVQPILFVGAFIGGLAAATGGASLCYLMLTHLRVRRPGDPGA